MAVTAIRLPEQRRKGALGVAGDKLGIVFVVPYIVIFLVFVIWPVGYGLWLGSDPQSYVRLLAACRVRVCCRRSARQMPRGVAQQSLQERPCEVGTSVSLAASRSCRAISRSASATVAVVVPRARIDEVAAMLAQVRAKEHEMGAAIEAGLVSPA